MTPGGNDLAYQHTRSSLIDDEKHQEPSEWIAAHLLRPHYHEARGHGGVKKVQTHKPGIPHYHRPRIKSTTFGKKQGGVGFRVIAHISPLI